jgi:hypothetical protein
MLKYLFVLVALVSILIGVREFWNTTQGLLSYQREDSRLFKIVPMDGIQILESKYITFSSSNQSIVYKVLVNDKEMAILDLPQDVKVVRIKRDSSLDSTVNQIFSKNIPVYKVMNNAVLYFVKHYAISVSLVLFGLLFLVATYALIKGPLKEEN